MLLFLSAFFNPRCRALLYHWFKPLEANGTIRRLIIKLRKYEAPNLFFRLFGHQVSTLLLYFSDFYCLGYQCMILLFKNMRYIFI